MKLNYEIIGNGDPIILLHGNGEDHTIFQRLANDLKDHYQCIMMDASYEGKLTYQKLCDDVKETIDALQLQSYDVIGFSDGGIIALLLAVQDPHMQHMITMGANTDPHMVKTFFRFYSYIRLVCLLPFCLFQSKARLDYKLNRLMMKEPHIDYQDLKKIKIPALILAGEFDLIKAEDTQNIADALPYSILKIIPQGNHFLLQDSYQKTYKEIRLFLDECHKGE